MEKHTRAVLYCRVARANQLTMDMQEQILRHFANEKGYSIVESIREDASGLAMCRPGIDRVRTHAHNGTADILLAHSLDRFGRDGIAVQQFIDDMISCGMRIETMNGAYQHDIFAKMSQLINTH